MLSLRLAGNPSTPPVALAALPRTHPRMLHLTRLSARLQLFSAVRSLRGALVHLCRSWVPVTMTRPLSSTPRASEAAPPAPRLKKCCTSGIRHAGAPVGKLEKVGGVDTCQ